MVNTNNEYEQTDILWVFVMAEAHSYGVSYAEDILFVTVKVRNESGDKRQKMKMENQFTMTLVIKNVVKG